MSVIIVKSKSLDCQSHESCSKKETNTKLELERKLIFSSCSVPLNMSKFMKKNCEDSFVKNYYHKHSNIY